MDWGPQYSGLFGGARKYVKHLMSPHIFPFVLGGAITLFTFSKIPITEEDVRKSKLYSYAAIMEERKAKTGSYH